MSGSDSYDALTKLRKEAAIGGALAQLMWCIDKALVNDPNTLACEMADESVYDFTRELVKAHRAAGHLIFEAWDAVDLSGRFEVRRG